MTDQTTLSTSFRSILFPGLDVPVLVEEEPDCFRDLNLDQIVDTLTTGRKDYRLEPVFFTPLTSVEQIAYRQEVYTDLAHENVRAHVVAFADAMSVHRARVAEVRKLHAPRQREFWMLSAMLGYLHGVRDFAAALTYDDLDSAGMRGLCDWLGDYTTGPGFVRLLEEGERIREKLDAIRFTMHIDGLKVTVAPYDGEPDYSAEVEATFERFRQGDGADHLVRFANEVWLDRVEEGVLDQLVKLEPAVFESLSGYVRGGQGDYLDAVAVEADRGLQFYLCCMEHVERLEADGLAFTLPLVSSDKAVAARDVFDLALAGKLVAEHRRVVTNSFRLEPQERLIVVTGANQGGKTTFSRTFGQLHWLAALGLPVAGTEASLFLFDRLFTHYERQEDLTTLRGKLEDELVRIHDILQRATSESIVIMNEIFNSTTLDDAIRLGTAVLRQIIDRDILALCVTFVDELTTLGDTTVSMVAAVDPADPASRTFRLERRPADGLAHALALAEKYGLTREALIERIAS